MKKVDPAPSASKVLGETLHRSALKCSPLPLGATVLQEGNGEPVYLSSAPKTSNTRYPLLLLSPERASRPAFGTHIGSFLQCL